MTLFISYGMTRSGSTLAFETEKVIFNRNEQTMGELFCFFILESILLGRSLNINPFNQPSVELIKKETKKILI